MDNLRVDGARLWRTIMETAQIGGTPKGGVNRQALTDLDGEVLPPDAFEQRSKMRQKAAFGMPDAVDFDEIEMGEAIDAATVDHAV